MEIAILGGTGDIGRGLALRIGRDTAHRVHIGSRDEDRAEQRARDYEATLSERGMSVPFSGGQNAAVARGAEVIVLAVPPYHVRDLTTQVGPALADGAILVSPAVGMRRDDAGFHYDRPDAGSVTELVAGVAPSGTPVVGAFHTLAADRLADLEAPLDIDSPVVGDDARAKRTVMDLTGAIDGLRPLDAGPLANAAEIEAVTPLLINIARHNEGLVDLGVRFT